MQRRKYNFRIRYVFFDRKKKGQNGEKNDKMLCQLVNSSRQSVRTLSKEVIAASEWFDGSFHVVSYSSMFLARWDDDSRVSMMTKC